MMETLTKNERLYTKKQIDKLFLIGERFNTSLFKVFRREKDVNHGFIARILISIPKKNIGKAVFRNALKRTIRETYRKQKQKLYNCLLKQKKQIEFAIIYKKSYIANRKKIEEEIKLIVNRLIETVEKNSK